MSPEQAAGEEPRKPKAQTKRKTEPKPDTAPAQVVNTPKNIDPVPLVPEESYNIVPNVSFRVRLAKCEMALEVLRYLGNMRTTGEGNFDDSIELDYGHRKMEQTALKYLARFLEWD